MALSRYSNILACNGQKNSIEAFRGLASSMVTSKRIFKLLPTTITNNLSAFRYECRQVSLTFCVISRLMREAFMPSKHKFLFLTEKSYDINSVADIISRSMFHLLRESFCCINGYSLLLIVHYESPSSIRLFFV